MQLRQLLDYLPVYTTNKKKLDITINEIKMDYREVKRGDVFVCIKGFTVDGHDFAELAVANGACVVVTERPLAFDDAVVVVVPDTNKALAILAAAFYGHPTNEFTLIGITGTNGKTTTSYILEAILKASGQKTGLIGTIQMKIGDKAYPIKNTTPDALHLQRSFWQMKNENVETVVMEVSSHALDLGRVYGSNFSVAVFTNLSQDHLDFHHDMDNYLRAKTKLFTSLGNDYREKKYAILNMDDACSETIAKSTAQPVITYGIHKDAHIKAKNINRRHTSTSFELITPDGIVSVTTKLLGTFNIYNILAAVSVSYVLGIPLSTVKEALLEVEGVPGRLEQVDAGQDFLVIVDYAHTPDSLKNVLKTINEFKSNKVYVVVGSGGDRDRSKRPLMAKAALQYSDKAIFTTDNPRTEDPKQILSDMTEGLTETHYTVIVDRKEAIKHALQIAKKGDIVLIAGKGHETYQEINGVRYDFDDRIVALEILKEKGI